ncbi:MAG: S8 family serine peptidase [Rhodospirillaceae bacterium]|nr:S8 family serine peptidase [Rhodospirillaceae bacterium]
MSRRMLSVTPLFVRWRAAFAAAALVLLAAVPALADVGDALKAVGRDGHARVIMRMRTGQTAQARVWAPGDSAARQAQAVDQAIDSTGGVLRAARVEKYRRFHTLPYVAAEVDRDQLLTLAASPAVEAIYLVEIERHTEVETPSLEKGANLALSVPSIDVPAAWSMGYDGAGTTIAVIDNGFNLSHPMLAGKAVAEACFSHTFGTTITSRCPGGVTPLIAPGAASNCPTGGTHCDHGTHVASIAVGNDGTNFGVARGAKLLPIDVFSIDTDAADCSPDPAPCEVTDSLAALDALDYVNQHAAEFKIAAVNISFAGSLRDGFCDDDPRKATIDMLRQKGIAVAVSAGNQGATGKVTAPGCISSATTVGASDNGTTVASLSNFATMVDFMAPGLNIAAASSTGAGLVVKSGTSMAAPHVAGAWAIMRQAFPQASFDQLDGVLKQTGLQLARSGATFTIPKIQVAAAIQKLKGKDRGILNNVVGQNFPTLGQSYLRFFNTSTAAGAVNVSLRDAPTGLLIATWTSPQIAPGASAQVSMQTIETNAVPAAGAPQTLAAIGSYNLDIASTFPGYLQHVLWNRTAGVFANLTSCGTGLVSDATMIPNVHSSALVTYVSRIRMVNTGTFASRATLAFTDPGTGTAIATWTSPEIPSGGSIEIPVPQIETQVPALQTAVRAGGALQFNVALSGLSGYLQHVVDNQNMGVMVDMSPKCALTVVPVPATAIAKTASIEK